MDRWCTLRGATTLACVLLALPWLGGWLAPASARDGDGPPATGRGAGEELRAAIDARDAGELEMAEARLALVAEQHPIIADYADTLRIEIALQRRRFLLAERLASSAIERHANSPIRARMLEALAEARWARGDEPGSRRAYELALAHTGSDEKRAGIHTQIAESLAREGQLESAAKIYAKVWSEYPTSPSEPRASAQLDVLERSIGRPFRSARDFQRRGEALLAGGRNEEALRAFDAAIARDLSADARRQVARSRATTLFRLRRYPEAAAAYEAFAPDPRAMIERARAIARAGDVPRSVVLLEQIVRQRRDQHAVRARLIAALLLDDEDDLQDQARALEHFRTLAADRRYPQARLALWRLGWRAYRGGRFAEARASFSELVRLESHPIDRLRPRYWEARSLQALGGAGASEALAELAAEYPFTYYGWRARELTRPADDARGAAPARERIAPGSSRLRPAELERARVLVAAGLRDEAVSELSPLVTRAGGLDDRLALARLLVEAGDFHRAQILMVSAYGRNLARGPVPGFEEVWQHAWPRAYRELISALHPDGSPVDEHLVAAVMREESGYRPRVVSTAGARGLLQIMPETGIRLAEQAGLTRFRPDDLFDPGVNIRLGSFYLDELARQFDGRDFVAVASYNAGPHVASRWLESNGSLEDDAWVESIPYSQTRAYVKRVLRSAQAYRALY